MRVSVRSMRSYLSVDPFEPSNYRFFNLSLYFIKKAPAFVITFAVFFMVEPSPGYAECKIVGGKIICSGPGNGDGGGTLIVVEDPLMAKPGALRDLIELELPLETMTNTNLENYRENLETINTLLEADRLKIENLRQSERISPLQYREKINNYHNAIENYRQGIELYRDQFRQ